MQSILILLLHVLTHASSLYHPNVPDSQQHLYQPDTHALVCFADALNRYGIDPNEFVTTILPFIHPGQIDAHKKSPKEIREELDTNLAAAFSEFLPSECIPFHKAALSHPTILTLHYLRRYYLFYPHDWYPPPYALDKVHESLAHFQLYLCGSQVAQVLHVAEDTERLEDVWRLTRDLGSWLASVQDRMVRECKRGSKVNREEFITRTVAWTFGVPNCLERDSWILSLNSELRRAYGNRCLAVAEEDDLPGILQSISQ